MSGDRTFFDLFSGAGGLGLAFRSAGFNCAGTLEPCTLWGNTIRLNLPENDQQAVLALGKKASLKPTTVMEKLGNKSPDVLLAQPIWPREKTQKGKLRKQVFLEKPNDWFGDPRNQPMGRILSFVKALSPKILVLPHITRIANRRDLGLLALHCSALRCLGYTVMPVQFNDAWYGAPLGRFRIVILAAKEMRLSEMAMFWPPDRLFRDKEDDPSWIRSTRKVTSLLDTWWPLSPPPRKDIPFAPGLLECFEDLPAAASPWVGGTAPLDQDMNYSRQPWGWYARHLRRWLDGSSQPLTMHVCLPSLWLGNKKEPDLHMGWLADLQWRQASIEARNQGERPPEKELHIPLMDILADEADGEDGDDEVWVKMPPPPVAGTPPLLWQDRFLRLFTGGSPERTFSLREEARLRSFPDNWKFAGGFVERLQQITLSFPPLPGLIIARTIQAMLNRKVPQKTFLPECPVAPHPRPPEERRRSEGSRGQMGELPFS